MPIPSIYINLEDDVSKVVERVKRERVAELILVCPKRCQLFADGINLKLLKKQLDLLHKEVFILTMDEKGQAFAREAGFQLKMLPRPGASNKAVSDIRPQTPKTPEIQKPVVAAALGLPMSGLKTIAEKFVPKISKPQTTLPEKRFSQTKAVSPSAKVQVTDSSFPKEIENAYVLGRQKKFVQKIVISLTAVALVLIAVVVLLVLPKATVLVYPKTEPVARDVEVTISGSATKPDSENLILPAKAEVQTLTATDKFESNGKKQVGNPAAGTVKIYNFTKLPINLKAATTILTVGSKNYHLTADALGIKPVVYSNPKTKEIDESSLGQSIQITAEQGGEDYNLPAGVRMEISNQVFGSKPLFLYAKTDSPVTGGVSRFLSVITQSDVDKAKDSLTAKLLSNLQDQLSAENLKLVDKAYVFDSPNFQIDKPIGSETPNFTATLKANVTALAIRSDDLYKLVYDHITATLPTNKILRTVPNYQMQYSLENLNLPLKQATILSHFEGQAVRQLDLSNASRDLVGKNLTQATEILRSKAEVDRIDITLAPSWQKIFPFFTQRININIEN